MNTGPLTALKDAKFRQTLERCLQTPPSNPVSSGNVPLPTPLSEATQKHSRD